MFEAEAQGLGALPLQAGPSGAACLCTGIAEESAFIVLEYSDGTRQHGGLASGREQLAAMHRHSADRFGWAATIPSGRRRNQHLDSDCGTFWREHRLAFNRGGRTKRPPRPIAGDSASG